MSAVIRTTGTSSYFVMQKIPTLLFALVSWSILCVSGFDEFSLTVQDGPFNNKWWDKYHLRGTKRDEEGQIFCVEGNSVKKCHLYEAVQGKNLVPILALDAREFRLGEKTFTARTVKGKNDVGYAFLLVFAEKKCITKPPKAFFKNHVNVDCSGVGNPSGKIPGARIAFKVKAVGDGSFTGQTFFPLYELDEVPRAARDLTVVHWGTVDASSVKRVVIPAPNSRGTTAPTYVSSVPYTDEPRFDVYVKGTMSGGRAKIYLKHHKAPSKLGMYLGSVLTRNLCFLNDFHMYQLSFAGMGAFAPRVEKSWREWKTRTTEIAKAGICEAEDTSAPTKPESRNPVKLPRSPLEPWDPELTPAFQREKWSKRKVV